MSAPYYPGSLYTPNLGLSLFGQDEVLAENMVLLDSAFGDGSSVNVNGSLVESPNLNNTIPAAPAGKTNVIWQVDGNGNISAYSTGGGGSTPGGPTNSIQYNAGSTLGGLASFYVNPANGEVTIIDNSPTNSNLAALSVKGDTQGDDVQDWYLGDSTIGSGADVYIDGEAGLNWALDADITSQGGSMYLSAIRGQLAASGSTKASIAGPTCSLSLDTGGVANVFDLTNGAAVNIESDSSSNLTVKGASVSITTGSSGGQISFSSLSAAMFNCAVAFVSNITIESTLTDSASSVGTLGQVLTSTVTGTAWATPSSGSGTVTTFSAGNLSPLFTTSVATATTTPALSFSLSNAAQNSVFAGPVSGGAGAPSYQTAPTISAANMTSFPTFNQNTTGTAANLSGTPTLPNGTAATTQTAGDTSTAIATDAFVAAAIAAYTPPATLWSALGNATGNLTLTNGTHTTTFNQTSNVAWLWANTTTGTSITINASPLLELSSQYYTGSATGTDLWTIGSALAAGTNGASTLTIAHSGSSGAATVTTAAVLATTASLSSPTLNFVTSGTSYGSLTNSGGLITLASNAASTGKLLLLATLYTGTNPGVTIGLGGSGTTTAMTATSGVQTGVTIGLGATTGSGQLIFAPTSGSANFVALQVNPKVNQTSSASGSYTGLLVNVVETALLGTSNNLLDLQAGTTGGTSQFSITNKGIVSKYNAIATVGNGVPAEYAASDLTAQSAAIAATTLYATTATGMYRVSWSATITTADGVSSVLGGTNGFQVLYTSPTDSVVKTTVAGNSVTSAANTTGTAVGGCEVIYAKTGTNIQFQYGYTSATPGQMVFELHCKVEAL